MSFSPAESTAPRHPLPDQLAKFRTPFHIFHLDRALEDAAELETGLKSGLPGAELFYSVKTNPLLPLLRALVTRGWGMEIVGPDNLRAATEAGCPGDRMLFNGAAWTKYELVSAIFEKGIRRFTADSAPMARLLAEAWRSRAGAPKLEVALRIHEGDSHFGLAPRREALEPAVAALPPEMLGALGLHLHANPAGSPSGVTEIASGFRDRARRLKEAVAAASPRAIDYLDLGGGIDSPHVYRPHPRELGSFHNPDETNAFRERIPAPRFSLREAGEAIARAVRAEVGGKHRILFEPGRAVCTRAVSTVIGVRAVKGEHYPDAQVVITDGSTAFLGPLHRGVHPLEPRGDQRTFVYGALPHSGDWLFQAVPLPRLREGDRLVIGHTGAYFLALEARFGHELPVIYDAGSGERLR